MLADVVPELRLGDEDSLAALGEVLHKVDDIFSPDIGEAAETEAGNAEDVLHSPNEGELQRNVAAGAGAEGLVEELKVEGVAEVGVVNEPVESEEEVLVDTYQAVVLNLQAQRSEGAVLPEVETACDFHITAAGSLVHALGILGIVVIVDEEEVLPQLSL